MDILREKNRLTDEQLDLLIPGHKIFDIAELFPTVKIVQEAFQGRQPPGVDSVLLLLQCKWAIFSSITIGVVITRTTVIHTGVTHS